MRPLRWGLIGCGDIARRRVAPALRDLPNCELVAVSRARSELAEEFAREFGAARWYADWRQLLADKEVEAVYVATPVHLHAEQTIAAAEAGKHVLCEKPMAMNTDECDRVLAACEAAGVRLGVAYYRHFYPAVRRVKEVLSSGGIGRAVLAHVNAFERFDPEPTHPRRWLIEKRLSGGGPMFDFGCHRIEVLLDLFGPVRKVRALARNVLFEREVEDTAVALFEFVCGAQAVLSVTHAARDPQDTLEIYGDAGSVRVDSLNKGTLCVSNAEGFSTERHTPHANLHQPLIEDFARAVLEGRAPTVDGRAGREVARLEDEIYADASRGAGANSVGRAGGRQRD
ncbi:MAG TPA: Gfo/Idh/MocA family oxidoreductase [Pyrinomonadaceae bacterium]|nr:Gfo/Idh/MocA family oxidoreductase [Pyrinomonadaceae bacterium]